MYIWKMFEKKRKNIVSRNVEIVDEKQFKILKIICNYRKRNH